MYTHALEYIHLYIYMELGREVAADANHSSACFTGRVIAMRSKQSYAMRSKQIYAMRLPVAGMLLASEAEIRLPLAGMLLASEAEMRLPLAGMLLASETETHSIALLASHSIALLGSEAG